VVGIPDPLIEAVCSALLDDLNDSVGVDGLPGLLLGAGVAPLDALAVAEHLCKVWPHPCLQVYRDGMDGTLSRAFAAKVGVWMAALSMRTREPYGLVSLLDD
jgi:hypothetical protein